MPRTSFLKEIARRWPHAVIGLGALFTLAWVAILVWLVVVLVAHLF